MISWFVSMNILTWLKIGYKICEMGDEAEKTWWFIETWNEERVVFTTLIVHPILFSIPIVSLIVLYNVITRSGLPDDKRQILENLDFYGIVACLGILTITFILKLLVLSIRGLVKKSDQ
jgi:hypothetical protein